LKGFLLGKTVDRALGFNSCHTIGITWETVAARNEVIRRGEKYREQDPPKPKNAKRNITEPAAITQTRAGPR